MRLRDAIYFLMLVVALASCENLKKSFCGDLTENQRALLDSIQTMHGDYLEIKSIPCEYSYINVYLKSKEVNDEVLIGVHMQLLRAPEGWEILDVFDYKGGFLFREHIHNGEVSRNYNNGTRIIIHYGPGRE